MKIEPRLVSLNSPYDKRWTREIGESLYMFEFRYYAIVFNLASITVSKFLRDEDDPEFWEFEGIVHEWRFPPNAQTDTGGE